MGAVGLVLAPLPLRERAGIYAEYSRRLRGSLRERNRTVATRCWWDGCDDAPADSRLLLGLKLLGSFPCGTVIDQFDGL